ncbi:MAG: HEAT repeat domain-containing protein [Candidatus Levyibacteriota bacterium]
MHQLIQNKTANNRNTISSGDTSGTEGIPQALKNSTQFEWEYFPSSASNLPKVINQETSSSSQIYTTPWIDFFDIEGGTALLGEFESYKSFKKLPGETTTLTEDKHYLAETTIRSLGIGTPSTGWFIFYRNEEQPTTQWKPYSPSSVSNTNIKDATDELTSILKNLRVEVDLTEEENLFTEYITLWVTRYSHFAISIIDEYFKTKIINAEQMSSILTALGNIKDSSTYYQRLQLFREYLSDEAEEIRYGAIAGLSSMNARESLSNLKEILETEKVYPLIGLLKATISKLENAKHS